MHRFAISTWSIDGLLRSGLPLEELPAQMAAHDISLLELCHFHLASCEPAYLQRIRRALDAAGVELFTLLIDTGDITAPDAHLRAAEVATISGWIAVAAALGARRVRISAGRQPPSPQVIERSASQLAAFSAQAAELGLVTVTENWQATAEQPEALLAILDLCAGQVGLCADTGNADATADKAATLEQLLPRASSVHFKARYTPQGEIDRADLEQCAQLVRQSGFDGVITLIYDRKVAEWAGVEQLRHALQPLLN